MSYNLTAIVGTGNESSMLTFTQGVNTVLMHDMLGIMMLLGIWLVLFISVMVSSNDATKASLASSFISFVLAVSLAAVGLVPQLAIFVPLIVVAITVALSWR